MSSKNKAKTAAKADVAKPAINKVLLVALANATIGNSFLFVSTVEAQPLVDAGYAEVNTATVDANGNFATRLTATGIAEAKKAGGVTAAAPAGVVAAANPASNYAIEDNVPLPPRHRFASTAPKFPFDSLQLNQSFLVPVSEETTENPAKYMASRITTANRRGKLEQKKFTVRNVVKDGQIVGARVWRIEFDAETVDETETAA